MTKSASSRAPDLDPDARKRELDMTPIMRLVGKDPSRIRTAGKGRIAMAARQGAVMCLSFFALGPALSASGVQAAQQAEPSLRDTARLLQEQLNAVGPLSYVLHRRDSGSGKVSEVHMWAYASNVKILVYKKPKIGVQCLFSYHDKETQNDEVIEDRDLGVLLNDIDQVSVKPVVVIDQDLHPSLRSTITTPVFRMDLHSSDGGDNVLFFSSQELANDIAKAIRHAAELCVPSENRSR
jgi:hypothetical protein